LLHLCGADRLIGEQAAQWPITPLIAYENVALFQHVALSALLHAHPVTLLHSARAARHFAGLVAAGGHDRASLSIAAISPAVAEAAGQGWQRVAIAPQTGDEALLRSAAQLMGA
jgi:uroporphyrinogen-III synthase